MKNKSLIVIIIGLVLILTGVVTFITKPSDKANDKPQTSTEDKEKPNDDKEEQKELRKISLEEISNDTAKEIIQFYLDKDSPNEKNIIKSAQILASNEQGKFYVRLELENQENTKDTEIQYLEDGIWKVKLPLTELGDYGEEYTEFWGAVEE